MRSLFALLLLTLTAMPVLAETTAARTITLVRHGHYLPDPKADPKLGPGLSTLGVAQARIVGGRLAAERGHFDSILVSPLTRAQETARVILDDLGIASSVMVPELAECTPPTHRKEITAGMPEAELTACAKQLDKLYAERFKPAPGTESHELMICHGNVIRYLITKTMGVDTESWLEMSVGHTSLTTIRIEADGSVKLIGAGDVGHLPPHLRTGAVGDPDRALTVP
jgi:serine/threonine-protein phosphatase PGAM5